MDALETYRKEGFVSFQLYQIEQGLKEGLDVSKYADTRFSWYQMEQIRLGLKDGLDVSVYALPEISVDEMEHIREKLKFSSGVDDLREEEIKTKKLKNTTWMIALSVVVVVLAIAGYLARNKLVLFFQKMEIELTAAEVTVAYKEPFLATDYLLSYTDADNIELILPAPINTATIGSYTAVYELKNEVKSYTKRLLVNVVDLNAPTLELSESEITVIRGSDSFDCRAFILSSFDDYDGNTTDRVNCSSVLNEDLDEQIVQYEVTDSSENTTSKEMVVLMVDPEPELEPEPQPQPQIHYQPEYQQQYQPPVQAPVEQYVPQPEPAAPSTSTGWIYDDWVEEESWSSGGSYEIDSEVTIDFGN